MRQNAAEFFYPFRYRTDRMQGKSLFDSGMTMTMLLNVFSLYLRNHCAQIKFIHQARVFLICERIIATRVPVLRVLLPCVCSFSYNFPRLDLCSCSESDPALFMFFAWQCSYPRSIPDLKMLWGASSLCVFLLGALLYHVLSSSLQHAKRPSAFLLLLCSCPMWTCSDSAHTCIPCMFML